MFKIKIYVLLASLLLSTLLVAQNDNDLIPEDDVFYIQSALNYGNNTGGFWDLPGEKDFGVGQQFSAWEHKMQKKARHYLLDVKFHKVVYETLYNLVVLS